METINQYYENAIQESRNHISSEDEDYLLGVKADELVQYYVEKYQLPLIEQDTNREISAKKEKAIERMHPTLGFRTGRDIPLTIYYPIIVKPKIEYVIQRGASTFHSFSGDRLDFHFDSLRTTVDLNENDEDQEVKIDRAIKELEKLISWRNKDVLVGNEKLKTELTGYIDSIQAQLEADNELVERIVERISIPLRKRTGSVPMIDFTVREEIKPVYPKAEKIKEPYLEKDKVESVLELLKNGGRSFETTPRVYSELEEPDLRDILLSHLNIVFEGAATGETFVKRGRTDIHLNMDKGSILSAECKFWDGEEYYLSMMNQLSTYLIWKQNYGILITFSRNKGFTSVIEKAKEAAESSPSTLPNSLKVIDSCHFVTKNTLPEDSRKYVTLHHLLFNLYYKE